MYFAFDAKAHVQKLKQIKDPSYFKKGFYFDILGVDKNSTQEQIKDNYNQIMKLVHPDVGGEKLDPQLMGYLTRAKKVLCNEDTHNEYLNESTKYTSLVTVALTLILFYGIFSYGIQNKTKSHEEVWKKEQKTQNSLQNKQYTL